MKIHLSDKQAETVAEELDCGLRCFYNLHTKEITTLADSDDPLDLTDKEEKELAEMKKNPDDYFEFEKMDAGFSFRIMEGFTDEIQDERFRNRLSSALNKPKPFRNFKFEVDHNGDYRKIWFDYKHQKMTEWVKNQAEAFNSTYH